MTPRVHDEGTIPVFKTILKNFTITFFSLSGATLKNSFITKSGPCDLFDFRQLKPVSDRMVEPNLQ